MGFKGDASTPPETFRVRETSAAKQISGPMLLAAHWSKQAKESVRIQITVVNKELPLTPFGAASGNKRK